MANLTDKCRNEVLAELTRLERTDYDMDPLESNAAYFTAPRHADDTFSDMIIALAVWLCILFLTVINVIVAIVEIKRYIGSILWTLKSLIITKI